MTFEINDAGTEVILSETSGEGAGYEDFIGVFSDDTCKYGGPSVIISYPWIRSLHLS